jgi:hypothetical protein
MMKRLLASAQEVQNSFSSVVLIDPQVFTCKSSLHSRAAVPSRIGELLFRHSLCLLSMPSLDSATYKQL